MTERKKTTEDKALWLNLQPSIYGVFAEIGAGQEVANHFYRVGAASGTIAKTISAYDMTISDSTYGRTEKYVSKERLDNILNIEYENLVMGLSRRSDTSTFFAFGSTVQTINYQKTNMGHGWIGVKFQQSPNGVPSIIRVHFVLHTDDVQRQRELIGIMGVNLLYGAYELLQNPSLFVESLVDNIDKDAVEINAIEYDGYSTLSTVNLELSLLLVKKGLTKMIMIGPDRRILQPQHAMYKKELILVRGRFRPPTKVSHAMFTTAESLLVQEGAKNSNILKVAEITFRCYKEDKELMLDDLINRIELISALGLPVIISNFTYHYDLIEYLKRSVQLNELNIVLGMDNLRKVFGTHDRNNTPGKILRLLNVLANSQARILVFPELNRHDEVSSIESLVLTRESKLLIEYLLVDKRIQKLTGVDTEVLRIHSRKVLEMMRNGDRKWMQYVPQQIAAIFDQDSDRIRTKAV